MQNQNQFKPQLIKGNLLIQNSKYYSYDIVNSTELIKFARSNYLLLPCI